jgi:hypothetical protein
MPNVYHGPTRRADCDVDLHEWLIPREEQQFRRPAQLRRTAAIGSTSGRRLCSRRPDRGSDRREPLEVHRRELLELGRERVGDGIGRDSEHADPERGVEGAAVASGLLGTRAGAVTGARFCIRIRIRTGLSFERAGDQRLDPPRNRTVLTRGGTLNLGVDLGRHAERDPLVIVGRHVGGASSSDRGPKQSTKAHIYPLCIPLVFIEYLWEPLGSIVGCR